MLNGCSYFGMYIQTSSINVHIHVHVHIHAHVHIHVHIHAHVHIHTHVQQVSFACMALRYEFQYMKIFSHYK